MTRTISMGTQGFAKLRESNAFYVDKTDFIRRWWTSLDAVTLVCRPRRFGKTLNLSMVECFCSTRYAGRGEELFGGLAVWDDAEMRALQGTIPVAFVSFAACKGKSFRDVRMLMCQQVASLFDAHHYLIEAGTLTENERQRFEAVRSDMDDATFAASLNLLCDLLARHHGVAPVVLLDEYDTPMQEAWIGGWWNEMVNFVRPFMNATFKTNPALGRGLITGVTRVSRESIFFDLNNLTVITTSTPAYEDCFGFTEEEVFAALDEYGMDAEKGEVKHWYDGFTFGNTSDIYNPWSITSFLEYGRFDTYWANTSGNGLISTLVRTGDDDLKAEFATLLEGGSVTKAIDEQVVFSELGKKPNAIWALLLASGYVRAIGAAPKYVYEPRELAITNYETRLSFDGMVQTWFADAGSSYNRFTKALLADDLDAMNGYLGDVVFACVSNFDAGTRPSARSQPERFYHGLVLGMLVELRGRYVVESNRESGYGRLDVALVPTGASDPAIVIEFKVFDARRETSLEDTVKRAHEQIEARGYTALLAERGIEPARIHSYGIAFRGKEVLVG